MIDWIRTLWDYHYWANHKLWVCVMSVSDADFTRAHDYSIGSLHAQVVHTMWAEDLWLSRLQNTDRPEYSVQTLPDRPSIRAQWDLIEQRWRDYLQQLTLDEVARSFEIKRLNGGTVYQHTVQQILFHIVNHATDHRAQMLSQIYAAGGETFEQDMVFYFREKSTP